MSKNKEIGKANMIKTLRITTIIMAVLAGGFIVFTAVFGIRSDEETEQFLSSAGVVEKFNKARGDRARASESQTSPLVKQAELFALYLNPPPKPKRAAVSHTPTIAPRPKGPVSAKFGLKGTCVYASHPELSVALIDEPGKGLRWVRQSATLGHLVIEQIKDGVVVVRDGERTFELVAARPAKRSLIRSLIKGKGASLGQGGTELTLPAPDRADIGITESEFSQLSLEEQQALTGEIFAELGAMAAGEPNGSGEKTDLEISIEEKAKSEKIIETVRVSNEEAEKLNHLGKELKDVQQDPNRAEDQDHKRGASSEEPNSPEKK